MKDRAETVGFIHDQFNAEDSPEEKDGKWHYGYVELRALMDFIYEDEPNCENELLINPGLYSHIS